MAMQKREDVRRKSSGVNMAEKTVLAQQVGDEKPDLNFEKDSKFAWLALACGFFTQVLILGVLHAFGLFFIAFINEFHTSKGDAAWVGSIAYGLSMFIGPLTGVVINKLGCRFSMMMGGLLCSVALLSSSFVEDFGHLLFTFSVLYGVGASMAITPTMVLGQDYFDKYLSLSVGIMTSGSSLGTLIMVPTTQTLINSVGWRNTFRVYAGTCLLTFLLNIFMFPITKTKKTAVETLRTSPLRRLIGELALWKNRVFIVWTIGITLVMFGYYIPYVHLIAYAEDSGITSDQGSILIMVLGGSTAIGRLMFGKIVQLGLLNRLHMHQLSMIICGSATMFLPLIHSFGGLLVYIIFFGLVDGCFVVLLPLMTCSLVQADKAILAWGFLIGCSSITFTLGPPIAGLMYDALGSYNIPFHVAGIPVISGALVLFLIPWAQRTSYTSKNMEAVGEVIICEPDVDVDFITLSRSSSFVPHLQGSEVTLSSYQRYRDSPHSYRTSSVRGNSENERYRPSMHTSRNRERNFSMTSQEENDELFSDMLRDASKRKADSENRSITASSRWSSRRSDIINMSLSSFDRSYPKSSVGVQTDELVDNISKAGSNYFLQTASDLCQNELVQSGSSNVNSTEKSRTSMVETSASGPIDQAVLEQIERLRETISSPTRAAELMDDPNPDWIPSAEEIELGRSQKSSAAASKTTSPKEIINSNPVTFDELLVPAETVSCALSPKHSPNASITDRKLPFSVETIASITPKICSQIDKDHIFSMDPLGPEEECVAIPSREDVIPENPSPLSTNPFNEQPNFLGNQQAFRKLVEAHEDVQAIVANNSISPKFIEFCKPLTGTGSVKEPSPSRDNVPNLTPPKSKEPNESPPSNTSLVSLDPSDNQVDPIFNMEQTPPNGEMPISNIFDPTDESI